MTVAITNSVPWVQYDKEQEENEREPRGFNIDLWHEVEQQLNLCSQWQYNENTKDVILAVSADKADVGLINFSASNILQLGLQTATIKEYSVNYMIQHVISDLSAYLSWNLLWTIMTVLVIATFIRWIVDRFQPKDYRRFHRNFIRDFLKVLWWNMNLILGWEGVDTSRGLALFFDLTWHLLGMILFGALLSVLTVSFSLVANGNQIYKQEDIDGKVVAILQNSKYAKNYLSQRDSRTELIEVDSLKQAFNLLETFQVDAIVHNTVELENFFNENYDDSANFRLLPSIINYQQYGIIINPKNAYGDIITETVSRYNEAEGLEISFIERLSNKWGIRLEANSF